MESNSWKFVQFVDSEKERQMLTEMPVLETERLILRRLELSDAPAIQRYAGTPEVASTTLNIPHPYPDGAAESFIQHTQATAITGEQFTFAITLKPDDVLIGCIGLHVDTRHNKAELGYWLGPPFWGQGYMTEAAQAVLRFGFEMVGLNRIHSNHFTRNPASGRVMQKAGMQFEGIARQSTRKDDGYEDLAVYGMLRSDLLTE